MARKPRIHFPGAVYHVMLRGNGGQDIFFCHSDRTRLYRLLQEGIERYSEIQVNGPNTAINNDFHNKEVEKPR